MSKEKQARRQAAGPSMDPAAISYQMSPLPGAPPGPGNMNGNPMNVTSNWPQGSTLDGGPPMNIYRDGIVDAPQMATVNPLMVPRSPNQQNTPMTSVGKNSGIPFGLQQQPDVRAEEQMEGMRLGQQAMQRGIMANPYMGPVGIEAQQAGMGAGMPGSLAANMPGTTGPPMLAPMTSMNEMTPGATPKKEGKGKRKEDRTA